MKQEFLPLICSSTVICFIAISGCSPTNEFSNEAALSYSSFHPASSPVVGVSVNTENELSFADREGRFYSCKKDKGCKVKFKKSVDIIGYSAEGERSLVLERDGEISPTSLTSIDGKGSILYSLHSKSDEGIYSFDVHKDKKVAVGRGDTLCIDLLNYDSGKLIYKFCIDQEKFLAVVGALKFSPQGDKLAVGQFLGTCYIWDIKQKKVVKKIDLPDEGTRIFERSINGMAFSLDGERLYVSTETTTYKFAITSFSVKDGVVQAQSKGIQGVHVMEISPDGKNIAAIERGLKPRVLLLDTDTLKIKKIIAQEKIEEYYFSCLDFSPDGKRLAVGDSAGEVRVYDLDTGGTN